MVIWLIGLSGSGKTTLGREVACQLRKLEPNTVLLDGDELRQVFSHDSGNEPYTVEGRRQNANRITALCGMLDRQGINVVCCILSIFQDMRLTNKVQFSHYFEIFMDAPLEILKSRDTKGLYAAAGRGEMKNVVGIDIPFQRPLSPDLIIDSSGENPEVGQLSAMILEKVRSQ